MLSANEYKKLTDPESVALVGVTSRSGIGSNNPLEVLLEWGYRGRIYPTNPKGGSILGHTTYRTLQEVPEIPDIAVICAPRDAVPELFEQCCQKRVTLVLIVAQGFFDGDKTGHAMQKDLLKKAKEHQIRIIGPNTLGIVNNYNGFCTSFMRFINPQVATGVLCQSGTFVLGAQSIYTGIGLLIDTGNTSDLEPAEVLGYMARDSRLKVLNLHIESMRDGALFIEAARDAAPIKPVIVYKTGESPEGAVFASSHTGALAGEYKVYEAAFEQCRLLQVTDVEEMSDLNKVFTTFSGIKGNRIAALTISGGAGIITVDAINKYGMVRAKLSPRTEKLIGDMIPVTWTQCSNPADVWAIGLFHSYMIAYRNILETFLEDPNIDAVLCISGSYLEAERDFMDTTPLLREMAAEHPDKPIVAWYFGQRSEEYTEKAEKDGNIVCFPSVNRAIRGLSALYHYHHHIKGQEFPPLLPDTIAKADAINKSPSFREPGNLNQIEVFRLLESYNISVPRWVTAANLEEAAAFAEQIGYPVAMKVLSRDIVHKTDVGGVQLNIRNRKELEQAYKEMFSQIARKYPQAVVDGVLIQEYLTEGVEVLLGSKLDPQFGPVVVFGSGGIYTEIADDIALGIPPFSREDLVNMVNKTKVGKILGGTRGQQAVDMTVLTNLLVSFTRLVLDNPDIAEMDINPLLIQDNRMVALDARIVIS
jgi:acetyltransferase